MNIKSIKRSDKLPRGSYFYLQVGHRFFGGWDHKHTEIEKTTTTLPSSAMQGSWCWGDRRRMSWRDSPYQRSRYGLKVPKYQSVQRATSTERNPTGVTEIVLVDDPKSAKQYRTKSQIEKVQVELERLYRDLDVKISIKLKE